MKFFLFILNLFLFSIFHEIFFIIFTKRESTKLKKPDTCTNSSIFGRIDIKKNRWKSPCKLCQVRLSHFIVAAIWNFLHLISDDNHYFDTNIRRGIFGNQKIFLSKVLFARS
jgi:hypothetical protein